MAQIPTDPLFEQQWYLYNTGENSGGTAGVDLNLVDEDDNTFDVWDDYTGKDISVGIVDDGVESTHEDLQANYNSNPQGLDPAYEAAEGTPAEASDAQGTQVAGIIAGVANNNLGIVGVAYDAKVTGFLYANLTDTDASILSRQAAFDISNNSWGTSNPFSVNFDLPEDEIAETAIAQAVSEGRNGLGTVFLWAAGNERARGINSNYRNYENSRYTIAVASVDANGVFAPYSSPGANVLVSAFGDEPASIVTSDRTGSEGDNPPAQANTENPELDDPNYTNQFNGTAAATPMVAGVVALMLQANPELGYRDVQEILAYSAAQNDAENQGWAFNAADTWNGGGLHVNHDYGFGLVDARAAVRLAETWQAQSTAANEVVVESGPAIQQIFDIPDNDPNGLTNAVTPESGLNIDRVEADVFISHTAIEDLLIKLTSPDGTESVLFDGPTLASIGKIEIGDSPDPEVEGQLVPFSEFRQNPNAYTSDPGELALAQSYQEGIKFTFSSTRYWGEVGAGEWTLQVVDNKTGDVGSLNSWSLRLYGDEFTPDNTYFYTDDFGNFADDSVRGYLDDEEGTDTINASAVTSDIILDLTPGSSSSSIAGNTLNIGVNSVLVDGVTIIENAFGGDGNDSILGNEANNLLYGGRGNDSLDGGVGNDSLYGGKGTDNLAGGAGDDVYVINPQAAGTVIVDEEGAADSLIFSDDSVTGFSDTSNEDIVISLDGLGRAVTGIQKEGTDLIIDLNQDGVANAAEDLTIENFFSESGNEPGTGFVETLGNISGMDIISQQTLNTSVSIESISLAEGNDSLTDFTFTVKLAEASDEALTFEYATVPDTATESLEGGAKAFAAQLSGEQEVNPTNSQATGEGTAELNEAGDALTYSLTVNGLDFGTLLGQNPQTPDTADDVKGVHFHNAATGTNGPIVFDIANNQQDADDWNAVINPDGSATISGVWEATDASAAPLSNFVAALQGAQPGGDSNLYFNVHTTANPGGEIRGQILAETPDYQAASGEISFAPGETEKTITVSAIADTVVEENEDFVVHLFNPEISSSVPIAKAKGTIENDDAIKGTPEDDELTGVKEGEGDDLFEGSAGNDFIIGGLGFNKVIYVSFTFGIVVNLLTGFVVKGGSGTDTLEGIQSVDGTNFADSMTGSDSEEELMGGDGNDALSGGGGNDTLDGGMPAQGVDNDTVEGGIGNDVILGCNGGDSFDGGDGVDKLSYIHIKTGVKIDLSVGIAIVGGGASDTLDGIEYVEGSNQDDSLIGGTGNDTLAGGGGNDSYQLDEASAGGSAIADSSGSADVLTLGFSFSLTILTIGLIGIGRLGTKLILDINKDGQINEANDLAILDFFAASGNQPGAGFIETVGGISGTTIINILNAPTPTPIPFPTPTPAPAPTPSPTPSGGDATGDDGNDSVVGGDGDETLTGKEGDDSLSGGGGNDVIDGGAGNDSLSGGTGNDTCSGGDGDETIAGDEGNDSLGGGKGNDVIDGGAGNDSLSGGTGNDTCNGSAGDDSLVGDDGTDSLVGGDGNDIVDGGDNEDTCIGGAGDDSLGGDEGNDSLSGSDGNDSLSGGKGNDICSGDIGNDSLGGDGGDDSLSGGEGNDVVNGGADNDSCAGDGGDDTLGGDAGDDSLGGGAGNDVVNGGSGEDSCAGDGGDDTLGGDGGNDSLGGGEGNDVINGGTENDSCAGDAGNDSLGGDGGSDTLGGGEGNDSLDGGADNDSCAGEGGNDTLGGDAGDDSLGGGEGNDVIDGGADNDSCAGGIGNDTIVGNDGTDSVIGNEGADSLNGNDGNDSLYGNQENDTLDGGDGNDVCHGGKNDDSVAGGTGGDTVAGDMGKDTVIGGSGNDTVYGNQDDDSLDGGDGNDTCHGGKNNDTVTGNKGNDAVMGDMGKDSLAGEEDDDYLNGNQEDDTLEGGKGKDTCHGGKNNDLVKGNEGEDALMGDLGDDSVIGGKEGDYVNGNQGNDSLEGGSGDDTCHGGKDNDTVKGNSGLDSLMGDLGNDSVIGGEDGDYLNGNQNDDFIEGGKGNDTCHGGKNKDTLEGNDGDDALMGDRGNDSLNSGKGNNSLYGNQGEDNLCGDSGNDSLYGGKDNDTVTGGKGNDFASGDIGDDIVIGVDNTSANAGMNEIDTFCGGVGADDFILADSNAVYYNGDGSGGMAVITDFNGNEDVIQLQGSSSSYLLVTASAEIDIYLKGSNGEPGDLIAKVQGVANLSIDASYFRFI